MVYAKFVVGIRVTLLGVSPLVGFYWKLLHKHFCMDTVQADLVIESLNRNGSKYQTFKVGYDTFFTISYET